MLGEAGVSDAFNVVAIFATIATVIAAVISAWLGWSGRLRGAFAILNEEEVAALAAPPVGSEKTDPRPFEVIALSKYYNHALLRANVSFWFSIIFGAIGFGVILISFATYSQDDLIGTVVKVLSGTVIDAVSGIFFVQSTNAQKSMAAFFENLRIDRLNAEARALIGEVHDSERADQLRAQLVLKYAGIGNLVVG